MDRLELLRSRRSVRSYSATPLSKETITKLKAEITMINTHQQGLRFQLITDDPDPLKSFSAAYGAFRNPTNYMAAVVDTAVPDVIERAGYFAEQFVIKAVGMGLGTCFVGGTFNENKVKAQMRAGEKILFIVLVGEPEGKEKALARMMAKMVHLKKMSPESFFEPSDRLPEAERHFSYLKDGLEAVACAPSSLNKRPVRLFITENEKDGVVCARVADGNPKLLIDLGIAKYNFNFATSTRCEWGNGSPLTGGED